MVRIWYVHKICGNLYLYVAIYTWYSIDIWYSISNWMMWQPLVSVPIVVTQQKWWFFMGISWSSWGYYGLFITSVPYNLTQVPDRHTLPENCESRCTCGMAIWSLNLCLLTLNEDICSWDGEDVVLTSRLRHIYWFDKVRLHMQTSRCVFVKFKYTKFGIQPINLT